MQPIVWILTIFVFVLSPPGLWWMDSIFAIFWASTPSTSLMCALDDGFFIAKVFFSWIFFAFPKKQKKRAENETSNCRRESFFPAMTSQNADEKKVYRNKIFRCSYRLQCVEKLSEVLSGGGRCFGSSRIMIPIFHIQPSLWFYRFFPTVSKGKKVPFIHFSRHFRRNSIGLLLFFHSVGSFVSAAWFRCLFIGWWTPIECVKTFQVVTISKIKNRENANNVERGKEIEDSQ